MTTEQISVRVSGPTDLIQLVPYLVGFRPLDSLVVIATRDDKLVVCTMCVDLDQVAALEQAWAVLRRTAATQVTLIAYAERIALAEKALRRARQDATLPVSDALWVVGDRWRSLVCGKKDCCPPLGSQLPDTPCPAVLDMIQAGAVALDSKQALADEITPIADDESLLRLTERALQGPPLSVAELLACERVAFSEAGRFAHAVHTDLGREDAWVELDSYTDHATRRALAERLREVARRVPSTARVPVLSLAAFVSWRAGDLARAGRAVDAALAIDPVFSMARVMQETLNFDPASIPQLRRKDVLQARKAESA